ncbi:hypothetical protein B0T19DRAFT_434934, partial [Cercophora scortea]
GGGIVLFWFCFVFVLILCWFWKMGCTHSFTIFSGFFFFSSCYVYRPFCIYRYLTVNR